MYKQLSESGLDHAFVAYGIETLGKYISVIGEYFGKDQVDIYN